jgi:hypothetical protein
MRITEFFDSKANVNLSFGKILRPTNIISFANGITAILSSGYTMSQI